MNKYSGYKAPKVYGKKKVFDARSADIWSLGIVLFMMTIGAPPFKRYYTYYTSTYFVFLFLVISYVMYVIYDKQTK